MSLRVSSNKWKRNDWDSKIPKNGLLTEINWKLGLFVIDVYQDVGLLNCKFSIDVLFGSETYETFKIWHSTFTRLSYYSRYDHLIRNCDQISSKTLLLQKRGVTLLAESSMLVLNSRDTLLSWRGTLHLRNPALAEPCSPHFRHPALRDYLKRQFLS